LVLSRSAIFGNIFSKHPFKSSFQGLPWYLMPFKHLKTRVFEGKLDLMAEYYKKKQFYTVWMSTHSWHNPH